MGMFDSVVTRCPKCHGDIEYQSKAGDCLLRTYDLDDVPVAIGIDINGDVSCCNDCGESYKILVQGLPPRTVRMRLE